MPLDELAINIRRSQNIKHNGSHSKPTVDSPISHARPAPLAVQSMLKTTTEIGDIGIFASRPPRLPRSSTLSSLGNRSRASDGHSRHHRANILDIGHGASRIRSKYMSSPGQLRRNDTVRSSMTAWQYQPRSRRPRPRPGPHSYYHPPYNFEGHHMLHSHRSLVSLRNSNGFGSFTPLQDSHYSATHGRLLPESVSLARGNPYDYHDPARGQIPQYSNSMLGPPTPRSVASVRRHFQGQQPEYNASAGASRSSQMPTMGPFQHRASRPALASRSGTPMAVMPRHRRFLSTTSLPSGPASPTDSIVPFYYDYSESFHGGETLLLPSHSYHPSIPEVGGEHEDDVVRHGQREPDARSPFGTVPGSAFSPAELPTGHYRHNSDQSSRSRHSRKASDKLARSPLSPAIELPAEELVDMLDEAPISKRRETQSEPVVSPESQRPGKWTGRNLTNSPQNWPSPCSSIIFTSASRSPRNLSDLAAKAHSFASDGRMKDMRSIDNIAKCRLISGSTSEDVISHKDEQQTFGLPSMKSRPLSIGMPSARHAIASALPDSDRAADIISPRPERPTTSESWRRFSRILDADHASVADVHAAGDAPTLEPACQAQQIKELSDNARTPIGNRLSINADVHSRGKDKPSLTNNSSRWSGGTSFDKSTVDSLLEKHIACLGLRVQGTNDSERSDGDVCETNMRHDTSSVEEQERTPTAHVHHDEPSEELALQRPTSLSSGAQKKLVPRRLFAGVRTASLPLANSSSHVPLSLIWTREQNQPSYGWLSLGSTSQIPVEPEFSEKTILSGEYADTESHADKRRRIRRHSTPSLPLVSGVRESTRSASEDNQRSLAILEGFSSLASRQTSRQRRKLRLHLKTPIQRAAISSSNDWVSTEEDIEYDEKDLQQLGITRAPVSAIDGLAELSGDLPDAPQRYLDPTGDSEKDRPPERWSNIVSAMPMPPSDKVGLKKNASGRTTQSRKSRPSVADPVNNSRIGSRRPSHEVRSHTSAPQLAQLDLGLSMRASQLDLGASYRIKSPVPKVSSFMEPEGLLEGSPPARQCQAGHRKRRFHSLRQMMPGSIRGLNFPPSTMGSRDQRFITSQPCRSYSPVLIPEPPSFPETVAMSDFAYRKHKLLEKFRDWLNRRCFNRRRRSTPREGYLL